jgi:elongation factor Ts
MAEISAAAVKALRDKTGLPMMECKRALVEADGDAAAAEEALRKSGKKTMESRSGRETSSGRIGVFASLKPPVGALVELQCESAPVANNEEFVQLVNDLVRQLATGPGAKTAEELLAQPSPSKKGQTLQAQLDDLSNRIREVFRLSRIVRVDAPTGGYAHHTGTVGTLVVVEGTSAEAAKDVAMHVASQAPAVNAIEELDPALVAKEREILTVAAKGEGKPDNIIAKMVEGRLRNFYAERVLNEQPFIKDQALTVGKYAKQAGIKVLRFHRWELGKE